MLVADVAVSLRAHRQAAPNVLRLIHRSNIVTNWVIRSVLEVGNEAERSEVSWLREHWFVLLF